MLLFWLVGLEMVKWTVSCSVNFHVTAHLG